MSMPTEIESDRPRASGNVVAQRVAILVSLAVGLTMAYPGDSNIEWAALGSPFVWRDVLLVSLLSALPAAMLLADCLRHRSSYGRILGEILVMLVMTGAILIGIAGISTSLPTPSSWLLRPALALLMTLPVARIIAALSRQPRQFHSSSDRWMYAGVAGLTLLVLPIVYVEARSQHDAKHLLELTGQLRFGEARLASGQLFKLHPGLVLRNRQPLSELVAQLETLTRDLEARVAATLPSDSYHPTKLERAQTLAMLGRTDEALSLLQALPASDPAMNNLCATIFENSNAWSKARDCYSRARAGWQAAGPSEARLAGILQACQGLGYCERKLGHIAAAEAAYRELLALAPTAENYFLLAQFYEDTQQSAQAYTHARRAFELAPQQYRDAVRNLIDQLATSHFDCLHGAAR